MGRRRVLGVLVAAAATCMVGCLVALVVSVVLNSFFLDNFDSHGRVDVPGTGSVELPAGKTTISFYASYGHGPMPVPDLGITLNPPPGVAKPELREDMGSTTSVNGRSHRRVWVAQIAQAGTYQVETDGNVNGYIRPQLAFGDNAADWSLTFWFGGLAGVSSMFLVTFLAIRTNLPSRASSPYSGYESPTAAPPEPSDDGPRIEQLKTLSALRDSGALTEDEFQAEKRRVLGGG